MNRDDFNRTYINTSKDEINMCLECDEDECLGKCQKIRCLKCIHRKYFGDLSIWYCELTNKTIRSNTKCPKKYKEELYNGENEIL